MNAISHGNHTGALAAIRKLEAKGVEARTTSTMRDMKNYTIVFSTLCRVAARQGGALPWDIDQYSRNLSLQIENASAVSVLKALRDNMLKEYCALVRNAHHSQYSALIQQMTDQIEGRFSQDISLTDLAKELSHSPSYLSLRFKSETGKTFSEYLAETRMTYAAHLLQDTDLPINQIASECGITDNNYFSRLFRKKNGMTPTQYRLKRSHLTHSD